MSRLRLAAAAALALSLSACQNALGDDYGPLTGTWKVTITGFQVSNALQYFCDVQTTYVFRQEGNEFEGESEESPMTCRDTATGTTYAGTKIPGVVRGEVENGRVHLSDAGRWHSFSEMDPRRMVGYLESYDGVGTMPVTRSGTIVMEKISDDGFYGPPA